MSNHRQPFDILLFEDDYVVKLSNIFPLNNHLSFHSLTLQQQNCHADGGTVIPPITSLLANKRRACSHASIKQSTVAQSTHSSPACFKAPCDWYPMKP